MTATTHTPTARRRPLAALARAEYLQFRRNKTLVFLGTTFPIGLALAVYFVQRHGVAPGQKAFVAFEMFSLIALLFIQYYSVLSLITTRRGEGVLKRLRTGEATDWQIQTAPAVPGLVLTCAGAIGVAAVVFASGAPAPVNPVLIVLALVIGIVVFSLLALATSAVTKNAEAAQVTSLPVMAIAMVGLANIRHALPERIGDVVDRTPFAAVSDLVSLGTTGKPAGAGKSVPALDFAGTFGEIAAPLATLVAWAIVAFVIARRVFKWDDRG